MPPPAGSIRSRISRGRLSVGSPYDCSSDPPLAAAPSAENLLDPPDDPIAAACRLLPGRFAAEVTDDDRTVVVRLQGELDLATAPHLGTALSTTFDTDPSAIVLDLCELTFVDSIGLGMFVTASRRAVGVGCSSFIRSPRLGVLEARRPTGIHGRINIDIDIGDGAGDGAGVLSPMQQAAALAALPAPLCSPQPQAASNLRTATGERIRPAADQESPSNRSRSRLGRRLSPARPDVPRCRRPRRTVCAPGLSSGGSAIPRPGSVQVALLACTALDLTLRRGRADQPAVRHRPAHGATTLLVCVR